MGNVTITLTQKWLNELGYTVGVDGAWGNESQGAVDRLRASTIDANMPYGVKSLAWGVKFKDDEIAKLAQVVKRLGCAPVMIQDFMGCFGWETNRTFSPSIKTPNASATGLIQFLEGTAKGLGTTTAKLAAMSVVEQLEYVYLYFKPYAGKLNSLADLYMCILWPRGVSQPDSYVLWDAADPKTSAAYKANSGLDLNKNGTVTRSEVMVQVVNRLVEGFRTANIKQL